MKSLVVVLLALLEHGAIAGVIDEQRLEQVISALPDIKLDRRVIATLVAEAIGASGIDLDPYLLLAQAYVESHLDPTATSRLIDGKRHTGSWPSLQAPSGWTGNLYCGVGQTAATTWTACLALRQTRAALDAQAHELRAWLRVTRGDLPRALAGYGCGHVGVFSGSCGGYPRRVLAFIEHLKRAAANVT